MKDAIELETPEQWKAVSHPLRVGILRLLTGAPQTNEELARALGVPSGKLYFHTKRLLEAKLIEPAGTRQKGPLTEKLYTAVARQFVAPRTELPPDASGDTPAPLAALIQSGLDFYRSSWKETNGLPQELHYGFHLLLPQSPAKRQELVQRLRTVFADFQKNADAGNDANTRAVSLSVLMHSVPNTLLPTSDLAAPESAPTKE